MEALWRARRHEGFRVIGVDLAEPVERVKAYVTEMNVTFPIVVDTTGEVARAYDVRFTPTHFLVDRAGVVRAGGAGGRDWASPAAHAAVRLLLLAPNRTTPSKIPARQDRADSPPTGRIERR